MEDQELDEFLLKSLGIILEEYKDCVLYIEKTNPSEKELLEDYSDMIQNLGEVLSEINDLDDLAGLDEELIDVVYEALFDYAGNFVIAAEDDQEQYKKDMEEYGKIEELLNLFIDDDYEDEDDE
ncbi:hypothetical protein [Treponema sp.]|uniref:hypothetical protein n=1 Tax=Treponema sp. TaxID=166 RepID=UPI00298D66E3|nr:hypothetical protein [Treponema sp.]MCQ2241651.1 hypothetical protein [Treponema sp.]